MKKKSNKNIQRKIDENIEVVHSKNLDEIMFAFSGKENALYKYISIKISFIYSEQR
jgi:hypothetical protein